MGASTDRKIKDKEAELIKLKKKVKAQKQMINGEDSDLLEQEEPQPAVTDQQEEQQLLEERSGSKTDKLVETLEMARGKRLLICIKGYPDPDNIATSLALSYMAAQFDIQSTIVHFEQISHHENRALVKKLDLDIEEYSDKFDYSSYDYYAINDSQNTELPIKLPESCELLVFVDHHKKLGTIRGKFIDIRESVGSTSAIYGEYLRDNRFDFSGDTNEESKIATALMHGIRSDTDNFVNATPLDYSASEFLSKSVDKDLLSLISRQSIPGKTMDLTQIALQRKDIKGTFMFSGVGYVREEDRDGIGQCADYLLQREGIETVVVYGVVGGEFVDGSLRTKSHTLDPDKWIKDVFGQDQHGVYYGGGRKDKGGFQIPLGVFGKCSDRELLWILIKKTIDELFYNKIGIDDNESSSD
ncbi:MAG: DHH family phosphoesterase [Oligoflexus sp.]